MASGPTHPNEQLKKRSRTTEVLNGKENRAAITGPHEQAKQTPIAHESGPIGPHVQAAVSISADLVDQPPPPAGARSRARNGATAEHELTGRRLRFNVSLQAKLAKGTDFAVSVMSPDTNRGPVTIESIHVGVYRKGESVFTGEVPIRRESKVNPGAKQTLPFSEAQKKELSRVLKSKTFALVTAVYTAPAQTRVTFTVENQDVKD
jgi:hypothetical protein